EDVRVGDQVLSGLGRGRFGPARVTRAYQSTQPDGIAITLRSGRRIVSTREHTHFAGFKVGRTPQLHMTYLMLKNDVGFRIGTSRTYAGGVRAKTLAGPAVRLNGEHADAAWVIGVHDSEAEARLSETLLSLRYGLPTLPFVARPGARVNARNSVVANQMFLD